jgi:hypothetical protein
MQAFLVAGSVVALLAAIGFLLIGIIATLRTGKPNAIHAYVFFVISMLVLALHVFLWRFEFGRVGQETQSTVGSVGLGQWGQILGGGIVAALLTLGGREVVSWWRKPRFTIKFDNVSPFCMKNDGTTPQSYWLRLKVTNSGKSVAKSCSGKLVKFMGDSGEITDYEPVKLHWVGTLWGDMFYFKTIDLNRGEYDFLDVLVTREDYRKRALLFTPALFGAEPKELPSGTSRIQITIHGDDVQPYAKEYSISWEGKEPKYTDIRLKEE